MVVNTNKTQSELTGYSKTIKFFNIEYDCDGSDRLIEKPEEVLVTVDNDFFEDDDWEEYGLADILTDETGWCVCSFDFSVLDETLNTLDMYEYKGDFASSKTKSEFRAMTFYNGGEYKYKDKSELTGYSKKFRWREKHERKWCFETYEYFDEVTNFSTLSKKERYEAIEYQDKVEEHHLSIDSSVETYTDAPDGRYTLSYENFNHHDEGRHRDRMCYWFSSSKLIVRSNLIDLQSLVQCTKELLVDSGYHGSFLEGVIFHQQGNTKTFTLHIGS